jgi:endonuclease YncB( thermonuclease family)
METRQVKVQALLKRSKTEPWVVSYVAPSGRLIRASINATDGGANVGPRLDGVLSAIERKVSTYPFQYAWTDFLNDTTNTFNARMNGDQLLHLEVSISLLRLLSTVGPSDNTPVRVMDLIPIATEAGNVISASEFKMEATVPSDGAPSYSTGADEQISSSDWLIVGKISSKADVIDGDTIDNFQVLKVGKKVAEAVAKFTVDGKDYEYDPAIKENDLINIRFLGINAPETIEHGYTQGVQRNNEYCVAYGVDSSTAFKIGGEAWAKAQELLDGEGLIVLEADSKTVIYNENGDTHEILNRDIYGRITAAVYKSDETDAEALFKGKSIYGENVCKTLLSTKSKIVPTAPLVMPYYYFIDNDPGRIDTPQWLVDVGIRKADGAYGLGDRIKELEKEEKDAAKKNSDGSTTPITDGYTVEVKLTESYNNQIDFIEAEDDRINTLYPGGVGHRVRIGDVALIIPPLAIEVNSTSTIQKIKTLRSKQSMMIKAGSNTTTLSLQLYFHDLDSINGYQVKMHPNLPDRYYSLDGLRPLLAQFKKAPFLPIDNQYINETLGIQSVALVNLSVQTVPGFPHSLSATLTLAEFEHEAYMPQVAHLGEAINYPLLRWYYNQSMRDDISLDNRSPYHTYLEPIPADGLTNEFMFQMVNEQDLIDRKNALRSLRYMDDPSTAEAKFRNPMDQGNPADAILNPLGETIDDGTRNPINDSTPDNTKLGKLYTDGWAAQHIIDQYHSYGQVKSRIKAPKKDEDRFDYTWQHVFDELQAPGLTGKKSGKTGYPDKGSVAEVIYGSKVTWYDVNNRSHYAPLESGLFMSDSVASDIDFDESDNGTIKIRLYEDTNIKLFPKKYRDKSYKDGDFTVLIVPGTEINLVQKILDKGREAEKTYVKEVEQYKNLQQIVSETEASFSLYDYSIPGLIVTGLQVMYENQFSTAQLQELGRPTFQFLGGQDPYVQIEFDADDGAIEKLKFLIDETERYSREYRTGITSGFLGVKNQLMQLFGIRTVMIENIQYRTVPNFPGRYQVSMTLCGFDKTQKRIESLEGISAVNGTPNVADIEAAKYNPAVDEAIIEMKMRRLEVYPDLELPRYDELNADLPYITTAFSIYENRTGGIYVDPDFYIATPVTVRELVREKSKTEVSMSMKDLHGVELTTSSQSPNMLDGTDEQWALLNELDGKGTKINPTFSWSGEVADEQVANKLTTATFKSEEVQKYVSDRKNLKDPPTEQEFNDWGLSFHYRDYNDFMDNKNPSQEGVYTKIYELLDKYFVQPRKWIYNDNGIDPTDKAWQKITYASREDMYNASYNHIASSHPKYMTKKDKDNRKSSISPADYKATSNKITRERMANIMKAVIHVRSKWKQFFETGMPMIGADGNAAGIMGIPLASEATTVEEARRYLWDWSYNMERGFEFLSQAYKAAVDQKDITYNAAPWDWMLYAYSTGNIAIGANTGKADITDMTNPFVNYVYTILESYYNNYAYLYATPTTTASMDIMNIRNNYSSHQMGIFKGNKDDLITDLLDSDYRWTEKKNDKEVKHTKAETKTWLKKKTSDDVKKIYESWMDKQLNGGRYVTEGKGSGKDVYNTNPYLGLIKLPDGMDDVTDAAVAGNLGNPDWATNYQMYKQFNDYMDDANNLLFNKSPQDIFPELFVDMIRYDQKYRLLRAFPTFQMFIIDEGRWMTNYKLWDNLYGYNAIQSIDIHKSRKIAADTAIISMTNIYSNLTSRAMDTAYSEYDFKFWDNLVWGNPNDEILDARKELLNSMYLQTGARIHLRMGYGSSAVDLPVIFNGTITELDTQEVVQIVAQSDGLELTNVISADPSDGNQNILICTEPRDLICKLLTSKGNWLKDVINLKSGDKFFRDNPLGIMHFGTPGATPPGNITWYNHDYGEAAQNIYSSNGLNTFGEYLYQDGSDIPFNMDGPIWKWGSEGDEANIIVPFYNNTTWDIAQTIAYCSPDYIAAVHPFELRSTLFFGKPYWEMAYQYDSRYEWNEKQKGWTRYRDVEHRKPFMQAHVLDGTMDIINNGLKASAEDIYTNVIVNYDGHQTPLIMADWDIRFDRQTTTVIDAQLVHKARQGLDFFTTEQQAIYYGASALRDYMKDMYKGEILILGDPTIKPHDLIFFTDNMNDMQGNILCKAVTHHFSHETGFVSSIQPDALVVNDDKALLTLSHWSWTFGIELASILMAKKFGAAMLRKVIPSAAISKIIKSGGKFAKETSVETLKKHVAKLPESDADIKKFKSLYEEWANMSDGPAKEAKFEEMRNASSKITKRVKGLYNNKTLLNDAGEAMKKSEYKAVKKAAGIIENVLKGVKGGSKVMGALGKVGGLLLEDNIFTGIAAAAFSTVGEAIAENWRRKKALIQAVLMMPVHYQGRQYTAGITGHKGMVVGDSMGKLDSFYSGLGLNGKDDDTFNEFLMQEWNDLTGANAIDYGITEEDLEAGIDKATNNK